MNILMVLYQKFPPDIRVEKEARSLLAKGYNIYLIASNDGSQKEIENVNGINVLRIKNKHLTMIGRKLHTLFYILFFRDNYLLNNINKFIKTYNIDIIHVHDLPLVGTSLVAARESNLSIIADLHENYPAAQQMYLSKNTLKNRIRRATIDRYKRWKSYERRVLSNVDRIFVVVPEAVERFKDYEIDMEKVNVVSNTEDINYFLGMQIDNTIIEEYNKYFVISYVGGFGPHRGVDCAIKAMPYIIKEIPDVRLLLVGTGGEYDLEMKKLSKSLNVEEYVKFTGWQPFNKVSTYTQASDVCLVPHNFSEHTDTTIPHKIFQYMLLKKPVVVSSCRPLKRIVEETQSGLVFKANDEKDLAEKIIKLYRNKEMRISFGLNGQKAVYEKYNWENTGEELCRIYEELESVREIKSTC